MRCYGIRLLFPPADFLWIEFLALLEGLPADSAYITALCAPTPSRARPATEDEWDAWFARMEAAAAENETCHA